ncbi:MAG: hypothetical protein FJY11_06990 [Bacteroidetes bacterium]|nr:hypothetical protein [Bacteroidota bacterium]
MRTIIRIITVFLALLIFPELIAQKAGQPVMLTSCGQSPGPVRLRIFMQKLNLTFEYKEMATAQDLIDAKAAGKPFKSVIIVTGASLKGMGAAGVSVDDELKRTAALIAEARKQGMKIIGAHVEGMARRSAGASAGDNSDELSIDAVCPNADILLIKNEGDSDGRFTTIAKSKNIPMFGFELNNDVQAVLEQIFITK